VQPRAALQCSLMKRRPNLKRAKGGATRTKRLMGTREKLDSTWFLYPNTAAITNKHRNCPQRIIQVVVVLHGRKFVGESNPQPANNQRLHELVRVKLP